MTNIYRRFLLIAIAIISTRSYSQTLTAINFNPVPGDAFKYDSWTGGYPGSSGISQLWDFSQQYSSSYSSYTLMPYNSAVGSFTDATYIRNTTSPNKLDFFQTTSSQLDYLGYISGVGQNAFKDEFGDPETIVKYPFSFGSSFTDNWTSSTYGGVSTGTSQVLCDATGTLITPFATYTNVLRVSTFKAISTATFQIYNWYTPDFHGELFSIRTSTYTGPSGTSTSSTLFIYNPTPIEMVGISEQSSIRLSEFYPNPANDKLIINLNYSNSSDVIITNLQGEIIIKDNFNIEDEKVVNVSSLTEGIYFIQLLAGDKILSRNKILIKR